MLPIWVETFGIDRQMSVGARLGPSLRALKRDVVGDVGNALWSGAGFRPKFALLVRSRVRRACGDQYEEKEVPVIHEPPRCFELTTLYFAKRHARSARIGWCLHARW
jgi:hypothetical protein